MNKPKFNIDAHAYWLLCEGQQVEVDGQKIQLTIVEKEKKPINLHKDSWGVLNDGSQKFKDTVIKWLNQYSTEKLEGYGLWYYGKSVMGRMGANSGRKNYFTHILTIDEFCAIAYPEKEEGSELVGKWVRCLKSHEPTFTNNKWYQCLKPINQEEAFSTNHDEESNGFQGINHELFDLLSPLDYNPETLVGKYYQGNQIESIYFDDDEAMIPRFKLNNGLAVLCKIVTPSDVTDTPPVKSLKYEDCFERVSLDEREAIAFALWGLKFLFKTNPRQAKQLAATIKLMTIMCDANEGWVPKDGEAAYYPFYDTENEQVVFDISTKYIAGQFPFISMDVAQRAYEANKEIFHDYFGIGGENE